MGLLALFALVQRPAVTNKVPTTKTVVTKIVVLESGQLLSMCHVLELRTDIQRMFLWVAEDTVASGLSTGRVRGDLAMRIQLPSARLVIPWRFLRGSSLTGLGAEVNEVEEIVIMRGLLLSLAMPLPLE
jgi:hypothetical protein